ncbi:helix-turn-helix domain-containing protein [Arthrobacter sp. NPDC056493]|uniref:helix-turn-helix domain-containing protein n=1 Tax=Arthrobacter sp. NPDC056493 TaxID=3345839 RepID=UPI00366BC2D5
MTRLEVLAPHLHEGVPVTRAAAAAGVPLRTARRWLSAYRARGLAGLVPAPRSDRAAAVSGRSDDMIEGAVPAATRAVGCDGAPRAAAVAAVQGWPLPSYTPCGRSSAAWTYRW